MKTPILGGKRTPKNIIFMIKYFQKFENIGTVFKYSQFLNFKYSQRKIVQKRAWLRRLTRRNEGERIASSDTTIYLYTSILPLEPL